MVLLMLFYQYRMEQDSDNISFQERERLKQEFRNRCKQDEAEYKAYLENKKTKARSKKRDYDSDEEVPGCWQILKKLSCTLQCGGTSCSIKETEQQSDSTSPPSVSPSLESINFEQVDPQPMPSAPKSRKKPQKKKMEAANGQDVNTESSAPAVKKVRKTSKKKQSTADPPVQSM